MVLALLACLMAAGAIANSYIEYRTAARLDRAETALCEALEAMGRGDECEMRKERLRLKYKERE